MQTIYGLTDPDGTIRYIGRTSKFERRVDAHLGPSASVLVREWVDAVRAAGGEPGVVRLRDVSGVHAPTLEGALIRAHAADGKLLNVLHASSAKRTAGADCLETLTKKRRGVVASIADELRVSRQAIGRWVHGTSRPETHHRHALERLFGIAAVDWMTPDERAIAFGTGSER